MRALWRMLAADARHHARKLVLVGLGLAAATALFCLLCAFGLALRQDLTAQFGQSLPGHRVEVRAQGAQVGPLELSMGGLLGDDPLTLGLVPELAGLPHVQSAHPVLDVALPMGAQGGASLFGRPLSTQIFMSAVPPELVGGAFEQAAQDEGGPIPVVVHDSLVALYNSTVAPSLGTPKVTAQALCGLSFDIVVGRSPLMAAPKTQPGAPAQRIGRLRAKIVGTSPFALPMGITVPWQTGLRLMAQYGPEDAPSGANVVLRAVLLEADGPQSLLGLGQEVAALGLHIDDTAVRVGQMLRAMVVTLALFGLFGLVLAGLCTVYAFGSYVQARSRELALVRMVGATPLFVAAWMLAEAACLGAAAGAFGVAGALGVAWAVPRWLGPTLATVPLLPKDLFLLAPELLGAAWLLAILTALLGSLAPTLGACRQPLGRHTHPE